LRKPPDAIDLVMRQGKGNLGRSLGRRLHPRRDARDVEARFRSTLKDRRAGDLVESRAIRGH
jgi:hypothetical protein